MAGNLAALTALTALVAPATAAWVVRGPMHFYPVEQYFLPSVNPFFQLDRGRDAYPSHMRDSYLSPFFQHSLVPRTLFEPRRPMFDTSLSSTLHELAGALDGMQLKTFNAPSWKEGDDSLEAKMLIRGVEAEKLKAEVSDGVLTVRGERSCDKCKSVVERSLSLPFEVTDESKINLALSADGVLTISVPKAVRAPEKAATRLAVVGAPVEKTEALPAPSPSPAAVEKATLEVLESKFPQAPAPPADSHPATDEKTSDEVAGASAEQHSATNKLRKAIHTAIGALGAEKDAKDAKNASVEAAAEAASEKVAAEA